jgi:hypothetical protein
VHDDDAWRVLGGWHGGCFELYISLLGIALLWFWSDSTEVGKSFDLESGCGNVVTATQSICDLWIGRAQLRKGVSFWGGMRWNLGVLLV